MKTGIIVQARTSSTRLPGKVLKELPYGSGITVLEQVIQRLKKVRYIDEIIIATTHDRDDDAIVNIAEKEKVMSFRGSREHVLERYYLAAQEYGLDTIVRITSDCPCIDPEIVETVIEKYKKTGADYTSNAVERTYFVGLDTEVFSFSALQQAYRNARDEIEKEHVVVYIHQHTDIFKVTHVKAPEALYAPDKRVTLDTLEDYFLLCMIFDFLYWHNKYFTAYDVIDFFQKKPWVMMINEKIRSKKNFNSLKEELEEMIQIAKLQGLRRAQHFLEEKICHI